MSKEFPDLSKKQLKNKDIDGGLADNQHRLTLPKNTAANLNSLERKEGTLVYNTDTQEVMVDDGSSLAPVSSAGGMNTDFSNAQSSVNDLDLGGFKIVNLADPTNPQDAATKAYADSLTPPPATGDPNTLAYFNNSGNLSDNTSATFDGTKNAMALGVVVTGGTVISDSKGSIAAGSADATGSIHAGIDGSLAMGRAIGAGSAIIASTGLGGTIAHGYAATGGVIQALEGGCYAAGYADVGGVLEASIGTGSIVSGTVSGAGTELKATLGGSIAHGQATAAGKIHASGDSSYAGGRTLNSGFIQAPGFGSHASGYADGSTIQSLDFGARSWGQAINGSNITANHKGSTAFGFADGSSISAILQGTTAFGFSQNSGTITSTVAGALAAGYTLNSSSISSGGNGSFALGSATSSSAITSTSPGGFAIGNAAFANGILAQSGAASFAGGYDIEGAVQSAGNASFAYGTALHLTGDFAQAFGTGHDNQSNLAFYAGRWAVASPVNPSTFVSTDPLFVLGNGANAGSRANAFQVDKDGRQATTAAHKDKIRVITGTDTLSARSDYKAICNAGAGSFNLNLPAGEEGLNYVIGQSAANSGVFTIVPNGGDVLDANIQTIFDSNQPVPITFSAGTWWPI